MRRFYQGISEFIFMKDQPQKADIIFIPGSSYGEPAEYAAQLWKQGLAPYLMPSGRYSVKNGYFPGPKNRREQYPGPYATEWEFLRAVLLTQGVKAQAILREDQAQFTGQNAIFSRRSADYLGIEVKRAILCCKSFHARRCYLYYQNSFPETEFFVCPVDVDGITRENWYETQRGIRKVLGELERCGSQFGDIFQEDLAARQGTQKKPEGEPAPLSGKGGDR